jgi:hypothetical protein
MHLQHCAAYTATPLVIMYNFYGVARKTPELVKMLETNSPGGLRLT